MSTVTHDLAESIPPAAAMSGPSLLRNSVLAADVAVGWLRRRALLSAAPVVIANGFPKAGTNLLTKALVDGLGFRRSRWTFHETATSNGCGPFMIVGVDRPTRVSVSKAERWLRAISPGSVVPCHLPYDESARQMLERTSARMVVMIRDPRDVAVSLTRYVLSRPGHFLHGRFVAMSPAERLAQSIAGDNQPGGLPSITKRFDHVLSWHRWPAALVIRFEDLVGPKGGGSTDRQLDTLARTAQHLGIELHESECGVIASRLFGGTHTFRSGQISTWRMHFEAEHVEMTKQVAGDLLVELGYESTLDW